MTYHCHGGMGGYCLPQNRYWEPHNPTEQRSCSTKNQNRDGFSHQLTGQPGLLRWTGKYLQVPLVWVLLVAFPQMRLRNIWLVDTAGVF